jgi:hypothetical protein
MAGGRYGSGFGIFRDASPSASAITGTGTANYVAKFTGAQTIGDSIMQGDGSTMSIGTAPVANQTLTIKGNDVTANYALVLTDSADATQFGFKNNGELELTALGKITYSDGFGGSIVSSATTAVRTYTLPDASGDILLSNLLGVANGIATLDAGGKVPTSQLPFELMEFLGNWDASTNTPTLANTDVGAQGNTYRVSVAGTVDFGAGNITFAVGDWCYNTGSIWEKGVNTDTVFSVNGQQGTVLLGLADILSQSNLTGANNISINSGQTITYNVGSGGNLNSLSTAASRTWNLPDASGTIALLSDIATEDLATTLAAGFTSGANDILMSSNRQIQFKDNTRWIGEYFNQLRLQTKNSIALNHDNDFGEDTTLNVGALTVSFNVSGVGGQSVVWDLVNDKVNLGDGTNLPSHTLQWGGLTSARDWQLPDASGTIALTSDIVAEDLATTLGAGNTTGANDIIVSSLQSIKSTGASGAGNQIKMTFESAVFGDDSLNIVSDSIGGTLSISTGTTVLGYTDGVADKTNFEVGAGGNYTFVADTNIPVVGFRDLSGSFQGDLTTAVLSAARTWTLPDATGVVALTGEYNTGATYTVTNVTTDRTYNANMTNMNEIADVLGTLIADLKTVNILL